MINKNILRKKESKIFLEKFFERWYGKSHLHYDKRTHYWWVCVDSDHLMDFPSGRWRRSDWWWDEIKLCK
ncbi:hypothetical protein [Thermoanaerobacterium thermosaccharolyticum]|uniref:hypothetical protein n=1 Tax=Thermoanaerobacterium thermosaccharolyticum TaxID=1517 RepID=UPI001786A949|nr:hypothetical protein [Thermoanaerobacterium thermosaccharolyticum]MBE0069934.1 hypothetical protein [Thermoanaerobacterium thermosaccharolyticum]MBE0228062.1 hypothetical protein [Thermoanaerobacterium thermosaccharolyticum]